MSIDLVDAAMYSGGTPSTIPAAVTPRISALTGASSVSIVSATFGRAASALTFGAVAGVHRKMRSPSQWNPIGITRGNPSRPVYPSRARRP